MEVRICLISIPFQAISRVSMRMLNPLTLAAIALFLLAIPAGASSVQVNATLNVVCPFTVQINVPQIYPLLPGSLPGNFTARTTAGCSLHSSTGMLTVVNQNNGLVVYTSALSVPQVTGSAYSYNFNIPTSGLTNTVYVANIAFDANSVMSSNSFLLVNGANLSITNFTAPSSVTTGASVEFGLYLMNGGELASGPINYTLTLTGPDSFNTVHQLTGLSPSQSSTTFLILTNASASAGTYQATAFITYNTFGSISATTHSTISYTVTNPTSSSPPTSPGGGGGGSGGGLAASSPLPQVSFTYLPLLTSGVQDQVTQSQLCMKDTGTTGVQIGLEVDQAYSNLLGLSASTLSLSPGQSACDEAYFKPSANVSTGIYTIPIHLSAAYQNGKVLNSTSYLTFSVYTLGAGRPIVASQVSLTANGTVASGIISITAPDSNPIDNATLVQWLPLSVARNISDITFYGLTNNITIQNNSYRIGSKISNLPAGQTLYEYYSIEEPTNLQQLVRSQYELYTLTPPRSQSILRLVSISAPQITGANGIINVSVLYTGTSAGNMTLSIVAPPQIKLQNVTQTVPVLPNQLVEREFKVVSHPKNGTYLLQLLINVENANLTYGVPIVVGQSATQPTPAIPYLPLFVRVGILLVLIVALVLLLRGRIGRQRYSSERAGHLIRIREQMRREGE